MAKYKQAFQWIKTNIASTTYIEGEEGRRNEMNECGGCCPFMLLYILINVLSRQPANGKQSSFWHWKRLLPLTHSLDARFVSHSTQLFFSI